MERNQIPYFSKNCNIQRTNWTLPENNNAIPKTNYIANTFNNYFASITETIKYIYIYIYIYYLSNESGSAHFLQPTDKVTIAKVTSSLNSNNTFVPNNICYAILFLLKFY